jgi:hypothetical protein
VGSELLVGFVEVAFDGGVLELYGKLGDGVRKAA